eukprot:3424416-Ditylum_brightwellii.AAC.2
MSVGRNVVAQLKAALAPHGKLLSGCHLVDCPHVGRKEVADKMIIVDAMHFVYMHMKGATLCFIIGDVDYAYLLSMLK